MNLFGVRFDFSRASAYDVFAPSVLNSAAGMSANQSSRRSSFRATAQEPNMYKENSPSPEKNDSALFVEEDRRMRRRGSQLYVFKILCLSTLKSFSQSIVLHRVHTKHKEIKPKANTTSSKLFCSLC